MINKKIQMTRIIFFIFFFFKSTLLYGEVIKLDCNPKIFGSEEEIEWEYFKVQVDTKLKILDYKEKRPNKDPKGFNNIVSSVDNRFVYFVNAVDLNTKLRFDYKNFIQSRLSSGKFVNDWDFRCVKTN